MPTIVSSQTTDEPHRARQIAESFGTDPERYDRTRPRYPQSLVDRIIAGSPGSEVLDVGIGTGVSARPFRAAGCRVLGVEPDPRMAEFARRDGFEVEVAKFEDWTPAGRGFDAVIAGTTWHWVDPAVGAAKAAEILRPAGQLALFWNVAQPPAELARAFSDVYGRVLPGTPYAASPSDALAAYERILETAAAAIRSIEAFEAPQRWQVDWKRHYERDAWLEQVPTFGGHSHLPESTLDELLAGIGAAIDAGGGSFTVTYATVAVSVRKQPDNA